MTDAERAGECSDFLKQIRRDILTMSFLAQVGHIPSALSMTDYLGVLFCNFVDPRRDRVVLGKPYGAQAYYAIFGRLGWSSITWDKYGTPDLNWRYCMDWKYPLIRFIDDTLGNTLSVACGIASAFEGRVYVNVSDAYLQAGTAWEAIMYAGARKLSNLLMTVDNNRMQVLGPTPTIVDVEPLEDRLNAFSWRVLSSPGHDTGHLLETFRQAFTPSTMPTAVILNTTKGHGVSFMEDQLDWHYRKISETEYHIAMKELE